MPAQPPDTGGGQQPVWRRREKRRTATSALARASVAAGNTDIGCFLFKVDDVADVELRCRMTWLQVAWIFRRARRSGGS